MNEPPETSDPETCARFLRELGASGERILPIAEAALALASFERPRVAFTRYAIICVCSPAMSVGIPARQATSPRARGRSTRSSC